MQISGICTLYGVDNSAYSLKEAILSSEYERFSDSFIGITQDNKARICFLNESEKNTPEGQRATAEAVKLFKEKGLLNTSEDGPILFGKLLEQIKKPPPVRPRQSLERSKLPPGLPTKESAALPKEMPVPTRPPPAPPQQPPVRLSKISAVNGFQNLGNTCYANASLKFLICSIGVENLYSHLLNLRNEETLSREQIQFLESLEPRQRLQFLEKQASSLKNNAVLKQYALYKLMDIVVSSAEQKKGPLEQQLEDFFGVLQLLPEFQGFQVIGRQQDPDEFFRKLGDVFQFDNMPAYTTSLNSILIKGNRQRNGSSYVNTYLQNASVIDRTATLQDIVNAIYAPEQIEVKWRENDSKNSVVTKAYELLVEDVEQFKRFNLHIAAFAYTGRGAQKIIFDQANFTERVLMPVIDKKTGQDWLLTLEPQEIIVHQGESANSGHYYMYSKNGDVWQKHDDSKVTKSSITLGEQAKMISFAVVEKSRA